MLLPSETVMHYAVYGICSADMFGAAGEKNNNTERRRQYSSE